LDLISFQDQHLQTASMWQYPNICATKRKKTQPPPQNTSQHSALWSYFFWSQALPVFGLKRITENLLSYLSVPFGKIPADMYV